MNTMMRLLLPFLALLLAAGCSTNQEKIYFASEATLPAPPPDTTFAMKGLSKADEQRIQIVIFGYLLERSLGEAGNYSAIFVQGDDATVNEMMRNYPAHIPPIKQSWHIDLRANQSPMDRDTGRPAMMLGVDVGEPNADGSVDVIGRWYAGEAVKGFYTFAMKKAGEAWTISSVK